GIYSIENYLTSRRLMYWQVYLHKTAVGYEKVLINTLRRAKHLVRQGQQVFASPALAYFLQNDIDASWFATHPEALQCYAELDDSDIWSALKVWKHSDDKILSTLATDMTDRRLFKVEVTEEPPQAEYIQAKRHELALSLGIAEEDTDYLLTLTEIGKDMYNPEDASIGILYKDDTVKDIAEASEILNVQLLSKKIRKYYLCYQRV
ncbi:MAG: phosphohydrolase, partial [Prevotella sp.]|nr:phosphohydrolase [Prevotella sp.]